MQQLIKYDQNDWILFIRISLYALIFSLSCQWFTITHEYGMAEDVRQHVWTYVSSWRPDLFQNDLIGDYVKQVAPVGVKFFYYIMGLFVNLLLVVRWLPVIFSVVSAMYIFRLGKYIANNLVGIFATAMFLFVAWWHGALYFSVGNCSNFGIVCTIVFLYYFAMARYIPAGIMLFITNLFYPPLALVCLGTYALTLTNKFCRKQHVSRSSFIMFCLTAVSVAIVLYLTCFVNLGINHALNLSRNIMMRMPEFYPGGRKPIFLTSWYTQMSNSESGIALTAPVKILLSIATVMTFYLRKRMFSKIPACLCWFFVSASLLFILSQVLLFKLSMPARYMRFPLPLFLIFLVAISIVKIRIKIQYCILIILVISISFIPFFTGPFVQAPYPRLYSFLKTLPKDSLIAGHLEIMDDVPLYSLRKAFVMLETSLPYYGIYPAVKKRTYDFFDAYYAEKIDEVYNFCVMNNITHLVVCNKHLDVAYLARGDIYREPFNQYILNTVAGRQDFALRSVPYSMKAYEDDSVFVIDVDAIKK